MKNKAQAEGRGGKREISPAFPENGMGLALKDAKGAAGASTGKDRFYSGLFWPQKS